MQCPLCSADIGDADDIWKHLLYHYNGSEHVAEDMGLQFLCPACRVLGVSLLLYSMSHHVATFIWARLQHANYQHCACPALMDSSMDTGSIPGAVQSVDNVSLLLDTDDDDSDLWSNGSGPLCLIFYGLHMFVGGPHRQVLSGP